MTRQSKPCACARAGRALRCRSCRFHLTLSTSVRRDERTPSLPSDRLAALGPALRTAWS